MACAFDFVPALDYLGSRSMLVEYSELVAFAVIFLLSGFFVHFAGFSISISAFHNPYPPDSGPVPVTPTRTATFPGLDALARNVLGVPRWHRHLLWSPRKGSRP